jgi:hypothetical protein
MMLEKIKDYYLFNRAYPQDYPFGCHLQYDYAAGMQMWYPNSPPTKNPQGEELEWQFLELVGGKIEVVLVAKRSRRENTLW